MGKPNRRNSFDKILDFLLCGIRYIHIRTSTFRTQLDKPAYAGLRSNNSIFGNQHLDEMGTLNTFFPPFCTGYNYSVTRIPAHRTLSEEEKNIYFRLIEELSLKERQTF